MKFLAYSAFALAIMLPINAGAHSDDFIHDLRPSPIEDMQVDHLRGLINRHPDRLKVALYLRNFTQWDIEKILEAKDILETVINSPQLKERVLNFTFKGERRFHRNEGMTNKEIYEHLMTGAEDLMPEPDRIINLDLTLYRSWNPWSTVKGYTKPDTMRIWLHTKYFRRDSWTTIDVAANLAHEWVHKMGFGHAYEDNPDRPYSVPYAIGSIVGQVAEELGF